MKKLLIDYEQCVKCVECTAGCSYFYHSDNKGYMRCLALAVQEHVCRKCDDAPCVTSCPQKALERNEEKNMLERYSMRCISCKSCTVACPFGVIIPEIVEYKTSMCDFCHDRLSADSIPECVSSCEKKALLWADEKDLLNQKNIYPVRDGKFYVKTVKWEKNK